MSPNLREKKKARTAAAIAASAQDLFAERGFASVTLAEIAAAAEVAERTIYRYFADKEELLFAGDDAYRDTFRQALAERPAAEAPFAALRAASLAVIRALEGRRDELRRRDAIIAGAPALQARARSKHAAWETALADGLRARDVAPAHARLLARSAVTCFDEAAARWLTANPPQRAIVDELAATFDELQTALAAVAHAPPHQR